ncbi:5-formyltetrahydrofolate cyclo-ligase, partial [Staphylococcus saprophyticus]
AFNDSGYRIGYGGGYFDKFISTYNQLTMSLIYDFQLSDFKVETHDQPVEKLIIATTR